MQRRRRKKRNGVLRGLIDVEDGSVAVDLPNLGTQHVIILTVLCFHCWGIFGLERFSATGAIMLTSLNDFRLGFLNFF